MFKKFFVQKLTYLIKSNKITNQELATYLHITRQTVSQFTKGTTMPSIEKLIGIADFFHITIDELLGRNNNYEKNHYSKNLMLNPDGALEYNLFVPILKTIKNDVNSISFNLGSKLMTGTLNYSFGIREGIEYFSHINNSFLFIQDKNDFIDYLINDSKNQGDFLSLVYLINQKLGLNYDAIDYNGITLIIKLDEKYWDLHTNFSSPVTISPINYSDYIEAWLNLSIDEKKVKLSKLYSK